MSQACVAIGNGACGGDGATMSTASSALYALAGDRAIARQPLDQLAADHAGRADHQNLHGHPPRSGSAEVARGRRARLARAITGPAKKCDRAAQETDGRRKS